MKPGERSGSAGRSVLVVDGDDAARDDVTKALRDLGWNVLVASDVRGAVERAAAAQPDVIVSELLLDDAHGYNFARTFKSMVEHDVPLIGITRAHTNEFARAREAGFDAVLGKPVDAPALDALLRAALSH